MKPIVLCIEDDPFFQTLIEESLSRGRHFELEFAASLASAREKLKNQNYDAIILDLSLPDGDGLRFLTEMPQLVAHKSSSGGTIPPVLILTGQTEVPARVAAFQLGADDFVLREGGGVSLEPDARKAVVVAYQERKRDEINHPLLAQSVPLGLVPLVQARLLARAIRDEGAPYVPFVAK